MDIHETISLNSGNSIPVMGLGTWGLSRDTAHIISKALDMGYPMIDTSGDYGTQPYIAEAIRQSRVGRSDFYLVTKVEEDDDSYRATQHNIDELKLKHIDLTLIHRPPEAGVGVELWQGLIRARDEGLTRDIGVSNYSEKDIQALFEESGVMPSVNQIEWSPFGWSQGMLDYCRDNRIVIQAYSPLTRGDRLDDEELIEIAGEYEKSPAQVLIRWAIQMGVVPIPKANSIEHLKNNLKVFDFDLTEDHMARLCNMNEQYSSLSSAPAYLE